MSKKEFDHLTIMRTRVGPSQGDATERQMLDAINDTGNFRTRKIIHPDGSETRMRTRGGMPDFITTEVPVEEETTCTMKLDNGVVDLISASFLGTAAGDSDDGILHRTDFVQQHITANPENQIDGTILPPAVLGKSPDDNLPAKSFAHVDYGTTSYDKKRKAVLCPSSVFTGKMRTYIQALYGRHDHAEMLRLPADAISGSYPMLYMDWTKQFGTEENPVSGSVVVIDTNCGIHTNLKTGEHSLIKVLASSVRVYRMYPSSCAKRLRAPMLNPETAPDDKERIEAYILSQSMVDVSSMVEINLDDTVPPNSMGYGWHFNLDGDKCDIVHNNSVAAYGGGLENVSIHRRLTFSKSSSGIWSAILSIVEGPVYWKSLRNVDVIAYPLWEMSSLIKFGAHTGPLPYGDAPIYVFYLKNELKVCRYSCSAESNPVGYSQSPYYVSYVPDYYIGTDSVDFSGYYAWEGSRVTFSCGVDGISYSKGARTASFWRAEAPIPDMGSAVLYSAAVAVSTGSFTGLIAPASAIPTLPESSPFGPVNKQSLIGSGEGTGIGSYLQETTYFLPPGNQYVDLAGLDCASLTESGSRSETYSAQFIFAIPFYDSEAIYLHGEKTTSTQENFTRAHNTGHWFDCYILRGSNTIVGIFPRLAAATFNTGSSLESTTETSTESVGAIVCGAGVFDASFPGASGFWSSADSVPQQYQTVSSASGNAIKAQANTVCEGMSDSLLEKTTTFVGWA